MDSGIQVSGASICSFACANGPEEGHECSFGSIKPSGRTNMKTSFSITIPSRRSFPVSDRSRIPGLHSQVIKLRAEDQHLSKDILEAMELTRERMAIWQLTAQMREVFATSSRTVSPSPLGMKAGGHGIPVWDSVQ